MEPGIYTQVKHSIRKYLDIDLEYYKDEQMRRRLDSWLARSSYSCWNDYFAALAHNDIETSRLRDYLTINVTEFFRDPDRWMMLRDRLLPGLLAQSKTRVDGLQVWSAGCSIGVEPYTLAILLEEAAPKTRRSILATDLDKGALQKARARGPYRLEEVRNLTPAQHAKYLQQTGDRYYARDFLTESIKFEEQDLNTARFGRKFDLIVCRNVIIYFTHEAKHVLYQKFQAALRPGGILFLGGTEIIPSPKEIGFKHVGYSFYIKEGNGDERSDPQPIY